jgi:membrane fusion protein (multidrug efflux system)
VAGQVIEIGPGVDDNRFVNAGQLLLQIDPADFKQKVTSAEAGVLASRGKLEQARAQQKVAEAQAASAKADVLNAEANARMTASDLERYSKLDPRAVSRQALDNARAAAASSQANLEAMQKKADAADAQVKLAATQIGTAEADVRSAEAALSNAKLQESYTTITAPTAGTVTRKDVEKGSYVQVGQALLSVVPQEVYVTANFKETQLTHMQPGDRVDVEVDVFPGRKLHGHVDSIQKGSGARFSLLPPENATGNYVKVVQRVPVKIVFDGGQDLGGLGPGMSVTPKVWINR